MKITRRLENKYFISYLDYFKIITAVQNILIHDKHGTDDSYDVISIYIDDIVFVPTAISTKINSNDFENVKIFANKGILNVNCGNDLINGKIEKKYNDVGINELCDFLGLIYKKKNEYDLHKIEISPINRNKEKEGNHSLLDLITFEFEYLTEKYVYNNKSIYMIS